MLSFLKQRYERRNPVALLGLGLIDLFWRGWIFVAGHFFQAPKPVGEMASVVSVLLVNGAHIGDVIISTAAIRRIKSINPNIRIGFVVGSWSLAVIKDHPGVDQVYVLDHWKLNRSTKSYFSKWIRYISQWLALSREIKLAKYDAGVLLNSFHPNFSALLYFAGCNRRLGYISCGGGPLLSQCFAKPDSDKSELEIQLNLLDSLGLKGISQGWLVPSQGASIEMTLPARYILLHPGSGNHNKLWPKERWIELAAILRSQGWEVLISGHGSGEFAIAEEISKKSGAINFVGRLSWSQWILLIQGASVVAGVDSAIGHASAAMGSPFVGIYSGIGSASRWAPGGAKVRILTNALPCSPCHTTPCLARTCLLSVTVAEVFEALCSMAHNP